MSGWSIDTNVLAVADLLGTHADDACVDSCVQFLTEATGGVVLVDDAGLVVAEYSSNVSKRQPGAGSFFLRWLWQNIANGQVCRSLPLDQTSDSPENFAEFPSDPTLAGFDPPDRKFVALVVAASYAGIAGEVVNAVDSDWRHAESDLARNGVTVRFLCPQHV